MRLKILWVGKTRNPSLAVLARDYLERIGRLAPIEVVEVRDASRAKGSPGGKAAESEAASLEKSLVRDAVVVALDEGGREMSSPDFARWLGGTGNTGAREIDFIIGGPDGLAPRLRQRADHVLSLGRMTWTHEMSRVLLLEQIFRSLCILRNIPYHR